MKIFYCCILIPFLILKSFSQTYTNPVINSSSADPGIFYNDTDGNYYLYTTDWNFFKSTNLVTWTSMSNPLNESGMFWAPEVCKRKKDGKFYMVYTLNGNGNYIAVSTSPTGPFNRLAGSFPGIDAHFFQDDDGKEYLYYNMGGCGGTAGIWVALLSADLKSLSNNKFLLGAHTVETQTWWHFIEECVTEAPYMIKHNGTYYLIYSGNGTGPNYGVGYATASSPTGPFTKYVGNPILWKTATVNGTGHCSFTTSPDKTKLFIVYHRGNGGVRSTCVDRAFFVPNPKGGPDILIIDGTSSTAKPYPLTNCTGQTINFNPVTDKETNNLPFQLSASSTSNLPVSFSVLSGPATLSGNTITLSGTPGTIKVSAIQSGNLTYCYSLSQQIIFVTNPLLPYGGTRAVIPGTIEAENFDNGGEGVAYHDVETTNLGNTYRTSEAVDILAVNDGGSGYSVGWMKPGEWLKYSVNVIQADTFYMTARIASNTTRALFHIEFDSINKSGSITIPNTSSETAFADVITKFYLSSGNHIMRLYIDGPGNFNLNKFTFSTSKPNEINELNFDDDWLIYPNPSDGNGLNIYFRNPLTEHSGYVEIQNIQGQLIYSHSLSGHTNEFISLANKPAQGIYFLTINYQNKKYIKKICIN